MLVIALVAADVRGQDFTYAIPDATVSYPVGTGSASFELRPTIADDPAAPGFPRLAVAFSLGLQTDATLVEVLSATASGPLASLHGGAGPDYLAISIYPGALTAGCVFAFDIGTTLSFAAATEVLALQAQTVPTALAGDALGTSASVAFSDTLGSPPVLNRVVVDFTEIVAAGAPGTVTFVPDLGAPFVRGDVDGSGGVNLADVIVQLRVLFEGDIAPCEDALDIGDDGTLEIGDAFALLAYIFDGGPAPAAPWPACAVDPSPDSLGCGGSAACP